MAEAQCSADMTGMASAAGRKSNQPAGTGRDRTSSKNSNRAAGNDSSRTSANDSNRASGKSVSRGPGGRADPARRAAVDVLRGVDERDAYANLLLPALLRERGLAGRDAALATELSYGTLRAQGSYDAILAVCSDRSLADVDPPLRQVLRLGAHQLLATRVRSHAAVATSVDLARYVAGPRPAGFVNAVLRRVATRDLQGWLTVVAPSRAEDLVGHLSVRYSHPRWIVTALSAALGEAEAGGLAETEAALAADGERPAVTLCAVPGRSHRDELVAAGSQPARWSEFGAYLPDGHPGDVPAVAQGRAAVQDEASQLAALALARAETSGAGSGRWLDMCARARRQGAAAGWPCRARRRRAAGCGRARAPGPPGHDRPGRCQQEDARRPGGSRDNC